MLQTSFSLGKKLKISIRFWPSGVVILLFSFLECLHFLREVISNVIKFPLWLLLKELKFSIFPLVFLIKPILLPCFTWFALHAKFVKLTKVSIGKRFETPSSK